MTFKQRQAHNALTFGDGYLTTGPCWQQHNTMRELAAYWHASPFLKLHLADLTPDDIEAIKANPGYAS